MSERIFQFQRANPLKPYVHKITTRGMWWAAVRDAAGNYYCDCFFAYEAALEKAREYASMNKEPQP
jgi:hypothetical protein